MYLSTTTQMITVAEAQTLHGLMKIREQRTPHNPAYHQYQPQQDRWQTWTWQEIGGEIERWRKALAGENMPPGDRVGILLANSVEWVCFEQAALSLGLVVVPLYTWDSPENLAYLLADSGCKLLLTGSCEQWAAIISCLPFSIRLRRVLFSKPPLPQTTAPHGISYSTVSSWLLSAPRQPSPAPILHPDDLATIVYTSGTTGPPKGVMLSHRNILANAEALLQVISCRPTDVLLSFLPLSHAFERTVGYYAPIMAGCSVAYSRSVEQLAEDLRIIRPTIFIAVPRIYEKVYIKIQQALKTKPFWVRILFNLTLDLGWKHFECSQGRLPVPFFLKTILHPLLHHLIAKKILKQFGGRMNMAVSGGAPLLESVSHFFLSLGLPLIQGYGLTEVSPVVSTNTPDSNYPASVGIPLPGIRCRLGTDNELLVQGTSVMQGYWNHPQQSRNAIDTKGWFHTGDQAAITGGRIYLRGRLKEIIITSTGEKIAPADVEQLLRADSLIDQAMIVGERRPYLAALIVLEQTAWEALAKEEGLDPCDPVSLQNANIQARILTRMSQRLHTLPGQSQIRTVALLRDDWNIANGLLTPTLKLKRPVIEQQYRQLIETLYRGHEIPR